MAAWTIQSLIDYKMTVTAHCQNASCHRHQELDLAKLKDRLGPDAPAMADDLKPKLKCGKMRRQGDRPDLLAEDSHLDLPRTLRAGCSRLCSWRSQSGLL
jgi:hypothetical protein